MYRAITHRTGQPHLALHEVLGFTPAAPRQAWLALRGDPHTRGSRFGVSSLRLFTPALGITTWLGRLHVPRRTIIVNLFNHTPTPVTAGWSVAVTQVRDFRGRGLTYNSHNGSDFVVPPGTAVVAAAPGRVVAVRSEYNRGGLKLYLDHGGGLLTSSNHLARVLVAPGDFVQRGQVVALSGYSGLDALVAFPWVAPHVHYNVSLGGVLVDPFAKQPHEAGTDSLWRDPSPKPWQPQEAQIAADAEFAPTAFDPERVALLLGDLQHPERRAHIAAIADPLQQAWELVIESFTYPARFSSPTAGAALLPDATRRSVLDLPFAAADLDGAVFADDVALRRAPARGR
jgi:murein DD-endopeptidase MepM/ murein hydrolase activator NlpD